MKKWLRHTETFPNGFLQVQYKHLLRHHFLLKKGIYYPFCCSLLMKRCQFNGYAGLSLVGLYFCFKSHDLTDFHVSELDCILHLLPDLFTV